jgi:hypothetical protein
MQNYSLLAELGRVRRPVLLKRGLSATIDELLLAAEHVMSHGNPNVILCERGIRTFETKTRNTFDVGAIPVLKRETHLPVIVDPSHAAGRADLVASLAFALYVFAFDIATTRRVLRHDPRSLIGIGLLIAAISALPSAFLGQPFFTAQWWSIPLGPLGELKLSTPLFFDIGVFLVVIGTVMTIVLALAEAEE